MFFFFLNIEFKMMIRSSDNEFIGIRPCSWACFLSVVHCYSFVARRPCITCIFLFPIIQKVYTLYEVSCRVDKRALHNGKSASKIE